MKRLTFKKPFNGMDNALKLIPESYKVDGKEFQITDGVETYDVRWDINEATVLRAENKNLISEDMKKMKHLMGFKSQDTLGNLKGEQRINENKSFGDVWNKTKLLINESEEEGLKLINEMKTGHAGGMGFSNEGNLEGNEPIAEMEKEVSDEKLDEFENKDVENLFNTMGDMSKIKTLASKINTKPEKVEAAIAYVNAIVGDNEVLQKQVARKLMNDKSEETDSTEINENLNADGTDTQLSVQIKVLSDALEYYKEQGNSTMVNELEADILQLQNQLKVRMGEEPTKYNIPGYEDTMNSLNKISIRKEGDRFDEIFEDLYSEEEGEDFPDLTGDGKVTQADILKGRGVFEEDEEFIAHGTYTLSNTGGYEVMLSDAGDAAKVRDAYGSDNPQTSDWLEIEYVPGEDGEMEPVIDPQGYDIPLNMVMRVNR